MKNKRFFAYGCSFTSYAYPTWADLIGINFKEYYNYGCPGAGNMYIFNTIMESDQYHKITKDDLVIVQWTCSSREDRYKDNKWICKGGAYNLYDKLCDFEKYFDFRGFVIRDLAAIKAIKKFLDYIGCEYYFLSMVPIITNNMYKDIVDIKTNNLTTDVAETYKDILDIIKVDFHTVLGDYSKNRPIKIKKILFTDKHPLPSEHYDYIQQILPEYLPGDKNIAENINNELADIYESHHHGWSYTFKEIDKGKKNIRNRL